MKQLINIIENEIRKFYEIHYSDNLFTKFKGQDDVGYERKHSLTNRGIYFHKSIPIKFYIHK